VQGQKRTNLKGRTTIGFETRGVGLVPARVMPAFGSLESSIQHPTADVALSVVALSRGDHGAIVPEPHGV
jgi:hypothetical protein